jgi:hypothetical protein
MLWALAPSCVTVFQVHLAHFLRLGMSCFPKEPLCLYKKNGFYSAQLEYCLLILRSGCRMGFGQTLWKSKGGEEKKKQDMHCLTEPRA